MVTNITPLPPAPVRGSTEATFSATANAFVAALPTMVSEINAAGDDIELAVTAAQLAETNAETAEVNAETAEAGAVGAANFKGEWSSLVGALAIPATVSHSSVVWLLKANLADVTASEPTLVNTDWIALTQPIVTGSIALTSEFELEGDDASIGMLVGLYSNGKVRAIKNHPGEIAFNAATSTFVCNIALSSTLSIKVYRDESDGNKVKAILSSIAGRKETLIGTPTTIASTSATYIHADKIDANNIIIVYQDTSDSSQGKAIAVNIAANVFTLGTPAVFNAGTSTYCKVAVLSTAKAVIVYRDEGNSNYGVANTVAISGLVLTPATEVNFKTAAVLSRSGSLDDQSRHCCGRTFPSQECSNRSDNTFSFDRHNICGCLRVKFFALRKACDELLRDNNSGHRIAYSSKCNISGIMSVNSNTSHRHRKKCYRFELRLLLDYRQHDGNDNCQFLKCCFPF
jgi:hypothetical protein